MQQPQGCCGTTLHGVADRCAAQIAHHKASPTLSTSAALPDSQTQLTTFRPLSPYRQATTGHIHHDLRHDSPIPYAASLVPACTVLLCALFLAATAYKFIQRLQSAGLRFLSSCVPLPSSHSFHRQPFITSRLIYLPPHRLRRFHPHQHITYLHMSRN